MRTKTIIGTSLAILALASALLPATAAPNKEKLMNPAALVDKAPATFKVRFETTQGNFVLEVNRAWAPLGADRFYNLVKNGFYDGVKFFRVVREPRPFMVQFGIHGDPEISKAWMNARIKDDPVMESNKKGTITYAMAGPHTRTTQVFINYADNSFLDSQGFSPFGRVVEGMDVVEKLYTGYGEQTTSLQGQIYSQGNAFLDQKFPKLDGIRKAALVKGEAKPAAAATPAAPAPEKQEPAGK